MSLTRNGLKDDHACLISTSRWVETMGPTPACAKEMDAPGLDAVLVGEAGQADAEKRARGCARRQLRPFLTRLACRLELLLTSLGMRVHRGCRTCTWVEEC
jgi:hypothetical protein